MSLVTFGAGASVHITVDEAALPRRLLANRAATARATMCCSALALAMGVLDITGASPRRRVFELMARHAAAPVEQDRLQYFGSAEGRDDLATYCSRERRTLLQARAYIHLLGWLSSCAHCVHVLILWAVAS